MAKTEALCIHCMCIEINTKREFLKDLQYQAANNSYSEIFKCIYNRNLNI